jgi:hypothetical protein
MKKNLGTIDRTIRILAAIAIGVSLYTGALTGTIAIVGGVVAALLLVTGSVSFCPLYAALKISSRKNA